MGTGIRVDDQLNQYVVNSVNTDTSTNTATPPSKSSHTSSLKRTEASEQNPDNSLEDNQDLLQFLNGCKRENENLLYRKALILSFFTTKITKKPVSLKLQFHEEFHIDPLFVEVVRDVQRTIHHMRKAWNVGFCASILTKLWVLTEKQTALFPSYQTSPEKNKLRSFIQKILERIESDKAMASKDKRKRTLFRDSDTTTQDEIAKFEKNSKWVIRIEPHPCPKCGHTNVITVTPEDELAKEISKLDFDYQQSLKAFKTAVHHATYCKNGTKRKTKTKMPDEPKRPNFPKQLMACMCCVTKCRNIIDGRGCHHCASLSKNNIPIPYDSQKGRCECALCGCECRIVFPKTAWQTISAETELEKIDNDSQPKKTKLFNSADEGTYLYLTH